MVAFTRILLAVLLVAAAGGSRADEAPFGLTWGPLSDVPRPSIVDRAGNITALYYRDGRSPASGTDTLQVILEVCRDEGLQQVLWSSRTLSRPELAVRYQRI